MPRPAGSCSRAESFFYPYSDRHSCFASGRPCPDGLTVEIPGGWKPVHLRHVEILEALEPLHHCQAEWVVVVEKEV